MREAASPRVPIDGLRNYTSGSVGKSRISHLEDMIGAQNERKPRVLMDLPASSMGAVILANEAIIVIAQPNEGSAPSSLSLDSPAPSIALVDKALRRA
jgi:hypothetical protein